MAAKLRWPSLPMAAVGGVNYSVVAIVHDANADLFNFANIIVEPPLAFGRGILLRDGQAGGSGNGGYRFCFRRAKVIRTIMPGGCGVA